METSNFSVTAALHSGSALPITSEEPCPMMDLRVPTTPLTVELHCTGGRRFVGDIFMPSYSSRHEGAMRPEEWVNTVPMFFPFRSYEANCRTIFNRANVVAMTVPSESNERSAEESLATPVFVVTIDAAGQVFEGRVQIDMPPTQRRVVDWMNGPAPFITLRAGKCHHLIQKVHITRVVEIREE
jgi:hypothetical protein